MDIANAGSALSAVNQAAPSSLNSAISIKMLDKALDMNETMNAGLTKMMEMSVNPHIGGNFDMYV